MARARADRYPSARELAEDLRRFQTGQLVSAHDYSLGERFGRWLRRYRAALAVALVALAALAVTAVISITRVLSARNRADAQRAVAEERRLAAEAAEHKATDRGDELVLSEARRVLDEDPTRTLAWLKNLSPGTSRWREARFLAADAWSRGVPRLLPGHSGGIEQAVFTADSKRLLTVENDSGDLRFWDLAGGPPRRVPGTIWTAGPPRSRVGLLEWTTWAVSPDASVVAFASKTSVQLWTGGPAALTLAGGHTPVAISPDGSQLAYAAVDGVRLRPLAGGAERVLPLHEPPLLELAFSPDGRHLVGMSDGAPARLLAWRLSDGHATVQAIGNVTTSMLAFHPDGNRVAVGDSRGRVVVWHLGEDRLEELGHFPTAVLDYHVEFTPDGKQLLAGGEHGFWLHFGLAGQGVNDRSTVPFLADSLSPDGTLLALADLQSELIRLVNLDGDEQRVLRRSGGLRAVQFSPDGRWLLGFGSGSMAELWSLRSPAERLLPQPERGWQLAELPDGKTLAVLEAHGALELWDGEAPAHRLGVAGDATMLAVSRDGRWLATAGDAGVQLWPVAGGPARMLTSEKTSELIGFSAGDAALLTLSEDASLKAWPVAGGAARAVCGGAGVAARLSPDGTQVAVWEVNFLSGIARTPSPIVSLCSLATGQVTPLDGHRGMSWAAAFSPDGQLLATGAHDDTVRIWDLTRHTSQVLAAPSTHNLAFVDRGHLATGSDDNLRIWDLATGTARVLAPRSFVADRSPDGSRLLTRNDEWAYSLWDTSSWRSRRLLPSPMMDAVLVGEHAAAGMADKGVHLYRDDLPEGAEALQRWLATASNARIGPDGALIATP